MELYYYTTTETMRYILSNGNIFATNMKYMNDSEEYLNGLKEVRDYILHAENEFKSSAEKKLSEEVYLDWREREVNSFSISFTTARDLLSQWSMYAKESGVSLKMEFENKDYKFLAYNDKGKKNINYQMRPQEVYYLTKEVLSEKEYNQTGKKIVEKMKRQFKKKKMLDYDDNIIQLWLGIAPFVKRADFGAEKEYRLVFEFSNAISFIPRVDFRNEGSVIKPYLDISLKGGWPVTEIIVGPGFNQNAVFDSIAYFLSKGQIKVPVISLRKMSERIWEYFQNIDEGIVDSTQKKELSDEWEEKYNNFAKDNSKNDSDTIKSLYNEFNVFIERKGSEGIIREYIKNNFLSLSGIVLRKSKIPYIF